MRALTVDEVGEVSGGSIYLESPNQLQGLRIEDLWRVNLIGPVGGCVFGAVTGLMTYGFPAVTSADGGSVGGAVVATLGGCAVGAISMSTPQGVVWAFNGTLATAISTTIVDQIVKYERGSPVPNNN